MSSPAAVRLLFLTDRFPPQPGGAAVSAERITRLLAGRGHSVHVLHLGHGDPGALRSDRAGAITVHRLGMLEAPDLTLQLADRLLADLQETGRFHLLHAHGAVPAGYLAAFSGQRFGVPSFVSLRGNDLDRGMFSGLQQPLLLWALQHAGTVGAVSRELVAKASVLGGRSDVHFTPNAVEPDLFCPGEKDPALLASLGAREHALLGFVGELRFKKGTMFVLEAFRTVRECRPAKLLLVGGLRGEDRQLLRRYLREYPDLAPDLHVVEYLDDRAELARWYRLLDLVLLPALWDGMPNALLEAMACGRVVVAADSGGIRDVLRHGETGFLVPFAELGRLGEGCCELLEAGETFRAEVGARARDYVLAHHRPEQEIVQLEALYAGLLSSSA